MFHQIIDVNKESMVRTRYLFRCEYGSNIKFCFEKTDMEMTVYKSF